MHFALIWWIKLETGSAFYLALAAFLGLVPIVELAPFAGVLSDRTNRKVLILVVDLLWVFATLVLVLLFWKRPQIDPTNMEGCCKKLKPMD